jgi:hippurate hydrolase
VRDLLQSRITELVTSHVQGYGGSVEIDYERGAPTVVNTVAETEFARKVAEDLVGPQRVIAPFGPVTGSEDFAYFLEKRPGCYLRIGNGDGPMVHNDKFDFNDANLTVGAAYWARLAETYLA